MENTLNQRIKILRISSGKEQSEFAEALNLSQSGYSSLERGRTKFKMEQLNVLCEKFQLDKNFIVYGEDKQQTKSNDIDILRQENQTLRNQVTQLMDTVAELTSSINKLLSSKLGKLEGNCLTYAETEGKIIPLVAESVAHVAKRAA